MPLYRIALISLTFFSLSFPIQQSQAQNNSVSQITAVKKAKLVLVVKAGAVLNGYSKPGPNNPEASSDSSEVIFDVMEVLKGNYQSKEISVLYVDHMGFNDKTKRWILIVDDGVDLLSGAEKKHLSGLLKKWPDKYVSSPDWLIQATDEELKAVKEWIKSQKTAKPASDRGVNQNAAVEFLNVARMLRAAPADA